MDSGAVDPLEADTNQKIEIKDFKVLYEESLEVRDG